MIAEIVHPTAGKIRLTGIPVKFSETPGEIKRPPPRLGEHTEEILEGLGISSEEFCKLKEKGVVG